MAANVQVAFLGTGLMGAPMASRLIDAGYTLRLWNRTAQKAVPFADKGARVCVDVTEAVRNAQFICLCLTDARAIEEVLLQEAVSDVAPGATVIDFSTSDVEAARDFASRLSSISGAHWLDSPVSGGVAGAIAGTLSLFVGGDAQTLKNAQPLLDCVAARVTHLGGVGAGQAAKLCNQLIVSTALLAIAEALALAGKLGVDAERLVEALAGGFADSKPLQIFGSRMARSTDPGPKVAEIRTMAKDVEAIAKTAAAIPMNMPLLECGRDLYLRACNAGWGADDLPALIQLYRDHSRQETI